MDNNDVLRRLRYILNYNDLKMMSVFGSADVGVTREQIGAWLKKDEDPKIEKLSDLHLAVFLNGLINEKRGRKDGPQAAPEKRLTNNMIFMKLKIALNLHAEAVLEILNLAGMPISKHELSAFFRRPGNRHYRVCHNQVLRNFLNGLQIKYRAESIWREKSDKRVERENKKPAGIR